jgi:hypothetical protein
MLMAIVVETLKQVADVRTSLKKKKKISSINKRRKNILSAQATSYEVSWVLFFFRLSSLHHLLSLSSVDKVIY